MPVGNGNGTGLSYGANQTNNNNRALYSKSSDDLLQEYGLDFSKLSTLGAQQPLSTLKPLSVAPDKSLDLLAELDPLSSAMGVAGGVAHPQAPPRAKKQQQQTWTKFD